jgi:hypothetical protein
MFHLYARIAESSGPSGTTVRVGAPRSARVAQAASFAVVVAIVGMMWGRDNASVPPGVAGLFLLGVVVVYVVGWLQMRPLVTASPEFLQARSSLTTMTFEWAEVDEVVWEHRVGPALSTRTEVSVRRRGRTDLERVAVLHFLRGNMYGAAQSREIGERFLRWCRHYGASTRLGSGPVIGPMAAER